MPNEHPPPSRTFTSPSGRTWTVTITVAQVQRGTVQVLRFTSGDLVLDMESWPPDWTKLREHELAQLVRAAKPPWYGLRPAPDEPHRSGNR